jgi:tetratricopeptide (TPR) repeat protein
LTVEIGSSPLPLNIDGRRQYFEARCLAGLGRLDEACRLYKEALKTVSNDPDVLRSYGLLRLKMGALNEAQAYLEQARAKSYRLDRRTWLASARLALYLQDLSQALDLYLEMVAADKNDVEGLVGLVSVSIRLGDIARLSFGLEKLADLAGLDSDIEIAGPEQLADFVGEIGLRFKATGDRDNHQILMDISRNSDFGAFFNEHPQPGSASGQAAALP